MRISVRSPDGSGRLQLDVSDDQTPWRIRVPRETEEALLDPVRPSFLAEGYPDWLRTLCAPIDADRVLAERVVAEVERRHGR
ncbi:MAG: hypothetical protein RLO52_05500 [Sandaracinaceae bacterium]|nr:hypothetical protein [Myxococcales bacterium]